MKNFFKSRKNKGNPFTDKDKGDENKAMAEETNTQEIIEEQTENNETETTAGEINENNTDNNSESEAVESEADKLKKDFENLNNQYLRLAADFDNYRKRQVQERAALLQYGAEECMKKVLEVVDNFDRAVGMVDKIDNLDKMKETFFILNKQLMDSLGKLGLEQIKCVGEKFDPTLHEAVMQTQTDEYPEETIINELQKGYKLGDKVIRPAMVSVAVK